MTTRVLTNRQEGNVRERRWEMRSESRVLHFEDEEQATSQGHRQPPELGKAGQVPFSLRRDAALSTP
jgi:hypothetical protein